MSLRTLTPEEQRERSAANEALVEDLKARGLLPPLPSSSSDPAGGPGPAPLDPNHFDRANADLAQRGLYDPTTVAAPAPGVRILGDGTVLMPWQRNPEEDDEEDASIPQTASSAAHTPVTSDAPTATSHSRATPRPDAATQVPTMSSADFLAMFPPATAHAPDTDRQ